LAAVDLSVRVLAKPCSTCPASTSVWAAIVLDTASSADALAV
jgi:hypothetical protein